MRWNIPKLHSTVLMAVLCATLAACAAQGGSSGGGGSPFVVVLPNGYLIDRDRSSRTRIVKRGGSVAVQGPIAGYTVFRNVVTGYIGEPPPVGTTVPAPKPPEKSSTYFVLDTASGKLDKGLDAAAWNNRLKELGLPPSPQVTPPVLPK